MQTCLHVPTSTFWVCIFLDRGPMGEKSRSVLPPLRIATSDEKVTFLGLLGGGREWAWTDTHAVLPCPSELA